MLQSEFLEELFSLIKPLGLTCLIDSNGTVPFCKYPHLLDLCDGVMLDIKAWDSGVYKQLTKADDNDVVKANLKLLIEKGKLTEVRTVCLPDGLPVYTDVENILTNLAKTQGMVEQQIPVKLLRFRPHGVIGKLADYPMPSEEQMNSLKAKAVSLQLNVQSVI